MGTRALIHIKDGGYHSATLTTIYTQCDGYPKGGIGEEIYEILAHGDAKLVNGYQMGQENPKYFNGMGCLAAYLVHALKCGIGSIYLYPPDTRNVGEEYTYTIFEESRTLVFEFIDAHSGKIYRSTLSNALSAFKQFEDDTRGGDE